MHAISSSAFNGILDRVENDFNHSFWKTLEKPRSVKHTYLALVLATDIIVCSAPSETFRLQFLNFTYNSVERFPNGQWQSDHHLAHTHTHTHNLRATIESNDTIECERMYGQF